MMSGDGTDAAEESGTKSSTLVLEKLARKRQQGPEVEAERVKIVLVSLHGGFYALRGESVKEILPLLPVFAVPGTPECLPGVINVRGQIESVLDVTKIMGMSGLDAKTFHRIVIGEAGGIRSGILVDTVVDVLEVPVASLTPPLENLEGSIRDLLAAMFPHGGSLVPLLDLARIFARIPS